MNWGWQSLVEVVEILLRERYWDWDWHWFGMAGLNWLTVWGCNIEAHTSFLTAKRVPQSLIYINDELLISILIK